MGEQGSARLARVIRRDESTPLLSSSSSAAAGPSVRATSPPLPPPSHQDAGGRRKQHHPFQKPARLYRRRVLVTLFAVIILIELGNVVIQAPINAIMEDNICRSHLGSGVGGGPAADRGANANP
ncbi:hypothetical protein MAPG_01956, partial [Magnaporthiopsis poae ATCC 64411]